MSYSTITGGGQLESNAAAAWNRLEEAYKIRFGTYLSVRSALRTRAEQERLYNGWVRRLPGFSLAARPGTSLHERGLSVDVAAPANVDGSAQHEWLEANGPTYGWHWTGRDFSPREAWHFDFTGGGSAGSPAFSQDVKNRQSFLNSCGYGLVVDGILGDKTKGAIGAFQRSQGLYPDKIWGPLTEAAQAAVVSSRVPQPVATPAGTINIDGIWGDATTRWMQRALGVAVDGKLGPQTYRALQARIGAVADGLWGPNSKRALQRYLGTLADGIIGKATVRALQTRLANRTF